jgi:ion channel
VLVFDLFVIAPLSQFREETRVVMPVVYSLFLLFGIATVLRNRIAAAVTCVLAPVNIALRWANHFHPRLGVERVDTALALLFCAILVAVILAHVFSPGRVNMYRIQGAIAVYLLFALLWAFAYKLVMLGDPDAFAFAGSGPPPANATGRLYYFSAITLTTVGYGDVTPVNPIARSLAALEGFTGQLFPAITLARLVALELYHKQQRGE